MSTAKWRILCVDDALRRDPFYKVQRRDGVGQDDEWYDCEEQAGARARSSWPSLDEAKEALRRFRAEAEGPTITVVHEEA